MYFPPAIIYEIQTPNFQQALPEFTANLIHLKPEILLGSSKLLEYDPITKSLKLSKPTHELFHLLIQIGFLSPEALKATTLNQLNEVFQQPQGQGGLLRKPGSERWDLEDVPEMLNKKAWLQNLFEQLGFVKGSDRLTAEHFNHFILFGATVARMQARILHAIPYLHQAERIYLLGSNRQLQSDEKLLLKETYDEIIETEANAFALLWEKMVPSEYQERTIMINSTRNGVSSPRPTTQTTLEDWFEYFQKGKPQSILSLVEQPYIRLPDQLLTLTLTKNANRADLLERIKNVRFHCVLIPAPEPVKISIVLDEIARHIYKINATIDEVTSDHIRN